MTKSYNLNSKKVLITGGTGSFGRAFLLKALSSTDVKEIRIFSRDEKKQDDMRNSLKEERLKFYIGDVRDIQSIRSALSGVDYVFHAAALKQVPTCEFFPLEAVKTNILGTENVLQAAIEAHVEKVICLSTDKAVYPINSMGTSKAMMEKVAIAKSRTSKDTIISITRYGNVLASRGSIIPLIKNQITNGLPITITDPNMTRFMMTLDEAVDLVLYAFENGTSGDIFIQKSPATNIGILVKAMKEILEKPDYIEQVIGTRHGEKLFEVLVSREEILVAKDLGNYYQIPADKRDLNYSAYIDKGSEKLSNVEEYTSHNTYQLDLNETKSLLNSIDLKNIDISL